MTLPMATSPVWANIISGKKEITFQFLAAKIFLTSAKSKYASNPSILPNLSKELFDLFSKNQELPSVKKDIESLLK